MESEQVIDAVKIGAGLGIIRKRRWYLWGLIIIYLPATLTVLQVTQSMQAAIAVFAVWLVLLCIVVTLVAVARCPQCGKTFHMRDSTLGFSRSCRHCGLHLTADSKK